MDFDFAMFVRAPLKLSNDHQLQTAKPPFNINNLAVSRQSSVVFTTWFHDEAGDTGIVDNTS
ncbi:MAG: hypothetical protein BroJett011_56270 [Chloroflexota bacterium]|nr:MAG: hypothetical protein BroJett011_56270 [Chloroflexota bacterium]